MLLSSVALENLFVQLVRLRGSQGMTKNIKHLGTVIVWWIDDFDPFYLNQVELVVSMSLMNMLGTIKIALQLNFGMRCCDVAGLKAIVPSLLWWWSL